METSTKIILKVIFAFLALMFLWTVRDVLLIVVLALILSSAMDPMVDYFSRKKIPRVVSVLTVYVLVLALAGLVVYLVVPPVAEQFKILKDNLPGFIQNLDSRFGGLLAGWDLSEILQNAMSNIGAQHVAVSSAFGVFNGLFTFVTVLVISFYLVAEERGMKKFVAALVPARHHESTMLLLEKIQYKMGLWVLGQIILSFSIFVLSWIGLTVVGLKEYALVLALFAGLMEVVPYIGPVVSAVPAVLIAFIQSPPLALVVAILYLVIQKTEGYVLVPKIMEKTVGTSPLAVLVALLIGFKLAGIIGLLIAVPLVGAITVIVHEFWPSTAS